MGGLLVIAYVVFVAILLGAATLTLVLMSYAWRGPRSHKSIGFTRGSSTPRFSFSLIVPARHEEGVIEETLDQLANLSHPRYEVLVVVGDDDLGMIEAAERARKHHSSLIRVVVDHSMPKNKPKALNAALPHCRGDVIGVFDAEDDVHPDLLRAVDQEFQNSGADIVQGGVQLMNFWSNWFSTLNVLEYFFWFRSRLHFHADYGFVPLGGNTVFVRADLLREADGWDGDCLAEDCELGIRLTSDGARVSVCYDPAIVTREETPDTLSDLARQRTRWNQGFLQVLKKGDWRRLPRASQRRLAVFTLGLPFLQALIAIFIPISIVTIFVMKAPVGLALLSFLPLIPTFATLGLQMAGLDEFGRIYGKKPQIRHYVKIALGIIPYQCVLAYSATRALLREAIGSRGWDKTNHSGLHRDRQPDVVIDLTERLAAKADAELDERHLGG